LITYVGFINIQNVAPATQLVRICDPFPRREVSLPPTIIYHSKHGCCNIIGMNPLNKPNIHVSNLHTYYAMSRGNIIEMNPLNKPNIHVSNLHTYYAMSRGLMLYLAQDNITLVVAICGHVIVAIVPTKVFYVCNLHFKSYMGHTMNPTPANSIIVIQGIFSTMLPFTLL
jgi:hypothetical protein